MVDGAIVVPMRDLSHIYPILPKYTHFSVGYMSDNMSFKNDLEFGEWRERDQRVRVGTHFDFH